MALGKVALEEHFLDRATVERVVGDPEELARVSAGGGVMPSYYEPIMHRLADVDDARLRTMDDNDIEYAVLSLTAPWVQHITETEPAIASARTSNDLLTECVERHADRYGGFAAVALQDPSAAADELRRCVRELGFVGDRIMFSVDYPYADTAMAASWIERAPISESDRRKIAYGNARTLLDI